MDSILNVTVSGFANFGETAKPKNINLIKWLTSEKYRPQIEQIRNEPDEAEQKRLKLTLPGITPSALLTARNEASIIQHSGLLAFDIDQKDNLHIENFADLKQQISNISCVAYCGLSCRGNGFWGLVPIKHPEKHKQHFKALQTAFSQFGINIDKAPANPASFRFFSYDPAPYFNHQAAILERYYVPPTYTPRQFSHNVSEDERKTQLCIEEIERQHLDITGSYQEWLIIGFSLAGAFGENGRDYFHRASQFYPTYSIQKTDEQFNRCLKGSGDIGAFLKRCDQYGIRYKNSPLPEQPQNSVKYGEIRKNQVAKMLVNVKVSEGLRKTAETENLIKPDISETSLAAFQTRNVQIHPEQEGPEYYHYSFSDLVSQIGEAEAIAKVKYYQELSRLHAASPKFVVHSCRLLTSYSQQAAA